LLEKTLSANLDRFEHDSSSNIVRVVLKTDQLFPNFVFGGFFQGTLIK